MARSLQLLGLIAIPIVLAVAGCAGGPAAQRTDTPPVQLTEESRCTRTGGIWRDNACHSGVSGGGY